ncbi:MAG: right-handed parallel beta-helix repeat-containing protein, partial [Acinetobacter sp.]|nr:right-handed parallel beta-helix repeat-containing protein [Acinetobacter sp.]
MKPSTLRLTTLVLSLAASGLASAETYIVDRYQDDSAKGSLRWAIEQSNANATQENEIHIQAVGQAPYAIKLNQPLPPIKSSVKIIGMQWDKTGEFIAIDGSNYIKGEGAKACPGANPEQYGTNVRTTTLPGLVLQDVNGVTLKGLDIHRFCIGVLVNRSSNNLIQHNRISNNYGGSGVMLTGDDGKGNPTSTTTNNNKVLNNLFVDNGDGLELTRGAAFNLVANNLFTSTKANPEPSQGIEILWGNDNAVVGNKFENYSDGLQINWGKRNYIAYNELT